MLFDHPQLPLDSTFNLSSPPLLDSFIHNHGIVIFLSVPFFQLSHIFHFLYNLLCLPHFFHFILPHLSHYSFHSSSLAFILSHLPHFSWIFPHHHIFFLSNSLPLLLFPLITLVIFSHRLSWWYVNCRPFSSWYGQRVYSYLNPALPIATRPT